MRSCFVVVAAAFCAAALILETNGAAPMPTCPTTVATGKPRDDAAALPIVEVVLLPRSTSIDRTVRLVAVNVLVWSLCNCLRTSGDPYLRAVSALLGGDGGTNAPSQTKKPSALDMFLAGKAARARGEVLPPRHMPDAAPLLGCLAAVAAQVLVTSLLPRWFVKFEAALRYRACEAGRLTDRREIEGYLAAAAASSGDVVDPYYRSSFRPGGGGGTGADTGLAVLVRLPREMRDVSVSGDGQGWAIEPLYRVEDDGGGNDSSGIQERTDSNDKERGAALAWQVAPGHPLPHYFESGQRRVYFDPLSTPDGDVGAAVIDGGPTLHTTAPLAALLPPRSPAARGLSSPSRLARARSRYGPYNSLALPTPSVSSAFLARLSSPLVVLQMVGRVLSMLEENFLSSAMSVGTTLVNHWYAARRSIVSATELADEVRGNDEKAGRSEVWALRPAPASGTSSSPEPTESTTSKKKTKQKKKKGAEAVASWAQIPTADLLPGDVFCVPPTGSGGGRFAVPVDALLLAGSCVADEAVLTGETVPQPKAPLDADECCAGDGDDDEAAVSATTLDMTGAHRSAVLFAGTAVVHCDGEQGDSASFGTDVEGDCVAASEGKGVPLPLSLPPPPPGAGAKCLALRTGSYSSRGDAIRSLASRGTGGHFGAVSNPSSERDALRLIAALSGCAVLACASLFLPPSLAGGREPGAAKTVSPFRRAVQCTRILLASIPSDLPLALSSIVHQAAQNLRRDADVACAQPGALLTSAGVDVAVFDKTGTLTADTQRLREVVPPSPTLAAAATAASLGRVRSQRSSTKKRRESKSRTKPKSAGGKGTKRKRKLNSASLRVPWRHPMTDAVLAGCHSLVSLTEDSAFGRASEKTPSSPAQQHRRRLVGDPLDLACLRHSRWRYNGDTRCATAPVGKRRASRKGPAVGEPVRLWQIRAFPFDPTRRTSSALVLVQQRNGETRLWRVVKGSPDMLRLLVAGGDTVQDEDGGSFGDWYESSVRDMGSRGMRTVAMGSLDVTEEPQGLTQTLFPQGMPRARWRGKAAADIADEDEDDSILESVERARSLARDKLHRRDVEGGRGLAGFSSDDSAAALDFVGFACFDASLRPSTGRVLSELRRGGTRVCMLTGDGVDAAVAVARQAGLIPPRGDASAVALLEVHSVRTSREPSLRWRVLAREGSADKLKGCASSLLDFSFENAKHILADEGGIRYSVAATGDAIEALFLACERGMGLGARACDYVRERISRVVVIARASPLTKQNVVSCLKNTCGHTVLMCGDGVNDVGAMAAADVAVAMMQHGDETEAIGDKIIDYEDERRREKLKLRLIGKNRKNTAFGSNPRPDEDILASHGVGESQAAKQARVKIRIDSALKEITNSAAKQSSQTALTMKDYKRLVSSIWKALKEERQRERELRKGGGAAARVLAEEEKLRRSILARCDYSEETEAIEGNDSDDLRIKPGEACLAGAFAFLRPCIDGADALIRAGIATAACSLSVHKVIALNSLMSCFNLATLFKDGFRYGKYLFNVELAFMMGIDRACYQASSMSRPRISCVRPEQSLFHGGNAASVVAQALIHLYTLYFGAEVAMANTLVSAKTGFRIRWIDRGEGSSKMQGLGGIITSEESNTDRNFLGRPKFRPNLITNCVFLLSVLQNAVVSLVNNNSPFYGNILESRPLCVSIGAAILFCLLCVSEKVPMMNSFLQLSPQPEAMKIAMVALFTVDLLGCFAVDRLSTYFLSPELWNFVGSTHNEDLNDAASEEERLLREETEENRHLVLGIGILAAVLIAQVAVSAAQ